MTIATGDRLPEATFLEKGRRGSRRCRRRRGSSPGGRVVLFGLPGAFTGTCSTQHVPSFIRVADRLRAKGVDEIVCVAVNDPHVMLAWGEATGAGAAGIRMLADADGAFTRALGLDFDNPAAGLFGRSKRYSLLAEDGVVTVLNLETSRTDCELSGGETMLGRSERPGGRGIASASPREIGPNAGGPPQGARPRGPLVYAGPARRRRGSRRRWCVRGRGCRPGCRCGPAQSGWRRRAPMSSAVTAKSRGSSGARGIAPSAMPQSMRPATRPRMRASTSASAARVSGATRGEEVGALDVLEEAGVHPVGGQPPPADGDDVAQHRLEGAVGVEGLERGVGAGVPVGDEAREEVVLGGEVAVDRALGVFGAVGDLLDGHRLPVVAVHERVAASRNARSRSSSSRLLRALVPIGVPPRDLRSRDTAAAVVNRS